jgi:DNA excision repair protein ERCC-6
LGDEKQFKREFYFPILAGQRQNASQTDLLNKVLVTKEFNSRTEEWILRRSKSIIAHKLTKKTDQLVYCKLSEFQIGLFKRLLNSSEFNSMKKQETLMFVGFFMKVANHPALNLEGFNENTINKYLLNIFPNIFKQKEKFYLNENCGKIQVEEFFV